MVGKFKKVIRVAGSGQDTTTLSSRSTEGGYPFPITGHTGPTGYENKNASGISHTPVPQHARTSRHPTGSSLYSDICALPLLCSDNLLLCVSLTSPPPRLVGCVKM
ncbi:hypothetical protein R1flu_011842 [Riccia fluitans]|uniref:Uncharacterized protein n=1 Tax=Riccia fluitans TaxID=41844 RepID=A0ABD1Z9V0_9MARC